MTRKRNGSKHQLEKKIDNTREPRNTAKCLYEPNVINTCYEEIQSQSGLHFSKRDEERKSLAPIKVSQSSSINISFVNEDVDNCESSSNKNRHQGKGHQRTASDTTENEEKPTASLLGTNSNYAERNQKLNDKVDVTMINTRQLLKEHSVECESKMNDVAEDSINTSKRSGAFNITDSCVTNPGKCLLSDDYKGSRKDEIRKDDLLIADIPHEPSQFQTDLPHFALNDDYIPSCDDIKAHANDAFKTKKILHQVSSRGYFFFVKKLCNIV